MSIDARLKRLEAAAGPSLPTVMRLIAGEGEAADDCIRRHGFDPDDESQLFIVRTTVNPPDHDALFAESERLRIRSKLH